MLGVNMASGWKYDREQDGLDEAAALAEYVKNKTDSGVWPEVTYWFLDNEQHLEKVSCWNCTPKACTIELIRYAHMHLFYPMPIAVRQGWRIESMDRGNVRFPYQ